MIIEKPKQSLEQLNIYFKKLKHVIVNQYFDVEEICLIGENRSKLRNTYMVVPLTN